MPITLTTQPSPADWPEQPRDETLTRGIEETLILLRNAGVRLGSCVLPDGRNVAVYDNGRGNEPSIYVTRRGDPGAIYGEAGEGSQITPADIGVPETLRVTPPRPILRQRPNPRRQANPELPTYDEYSDQEE